jgi:hypothetical protein
MADGTWLADCSSRLWSSIALARVDHERGVRGSAYIHTARVLQTPAGATRHAPMQKAAAARKRHAARRRFGPRRLGSERTDRPAHVCIYGEPRPGADVAAVRALLRMTCRTTRLAPRAQAAPRSGSPAHRDPSLHESAAAASPLPHLHRDWAHPAHICIGFGPTPCAGTEPSDSAAEEEEWHYGGMPVGSMPACA